MKKMQKMIAVLFSVAMCAAMAVPAFAAETDTARNEEQETVMPRAIVYEEINIPGDGKFYKITDDFEMPAKSRVSFQGTWSPAYARLEFRLYAHSTGNGAYVTPDRSQGSGRRRAGCRLKFFFSELRFP